MLHRGAAAFVALLACGLFAPTALATSGSHPAATAQPAAAAPGATAAADPEAGSAAIMASPAGSANGPQQGLLPADDAQTDSAAPVDTTTPTTTSTTGQSADPAAIATQQQPINVVVIVRINSPGNDGPITQNNITVASSTAANSASTTQGGGLGTEAMTAQQANLTAIATQDGAENLVSAMRVASPGKIGAISQANAALSASNAKNTSNTTQQVAAPKPAVEPQPRRAGAAYSRQAVRPRHRQPAATVWAPAESSQPQVLTAHAGLAATPHRAAIQKAPPHRQQALGETARGHAHHLPTLSGIASGAAEALSPFVHHTSPAAGATGSQDVSGPVLLTLLLAAAAAAASFALIRRAPARRRAVSRRTPR